MKPGQTCATCAAFNPLDKTCRRESPRPLPVPQPAGFQIAGISPATTDADWCLQWISNDTTKDEE
jgi:hypothetical protein